MNRVAIIGGGPAGLTAAIYTARAKLNPIVFEGQMAGGVAPGGQLTMTQDIENFPGFENGIGGFELTQKMRQQAVNQGAKIMTETVSEIDLSKRPFNIKSDTKQYQAESVIIATGATAKKLGIPGENKYWQKGISACAVCDGGLPIFRNKHLVVVGGGDTACEEALWLTKFASKVTLVVRRDVLRASKIMQQQVLNNEKINILWNSNVIEAKGNEQQLTGLLIRNNQTQEESEMEVAGLFYAIGHHPNTDFLAGQVSRDTAGYIITKPGSTQTNVDGVFAAGDVQDPHFRQAITAAGSGCQAGLEVNHFLES